MRKLILLGANNPEAARQARALIKCGAVHIEGFLDNDAAKHGTDFCGFPVFGGFELLPEWVARGVELREPHYARHADPSSDYARDD